MSKPAATVDSYHSCPLYDGKSPHIGGPGIRGQASPNVKIGGKAALRVGDPLQCKGSPDKVVTGSKRVRINSRGAARISDRTEHGGILISGGVNNVRIG